MFPAAERARRSGVSPRSSHTEAAVAGRSRAVMVVLDASALLAWGNQPPIVQIR